MKRGAATEAGRGYRGAVRRAVSLLAAAANTRNIGALRDFSECRIFDIGIPGLFGEILGMAEIVGYGLSENRVAVIGIIVEDVESVEALNKIIHDYREIVLGRMGIPYRHRGINIMSIAVDGPVPAINALSGKIGRLSGVTVKVAYAATP